MMILGLLTTIIFGPVLPSFGAETIDRTVHQTRYVWVLDQKNAFKGQCYEIDQATSGERFNAKVSTYNCKPSELTYQWHPDKSGIGGKCYEIHASLGAAGYVDQTGDGKCAPAKLSYQLIESTCYAKGTTANGQEYLNRTGLRDCRPSESRYEFVYDAAAMRGNCFEVDASGASQFKKNAPIDKCRPSKVTYIFDHQSLKCYEVDAVAGPSGYLYQSAREKCLEQKNVTYAFSSGECFQKTMDSAGQEVILKVSTNECRPERTLFIFKFESRYEGNCFEVDELTQGQKFLAQVAVDKCRPAKTVYTYVDEIKSCLEIDEEGMGTNFVKRALNSHCESAASKPKWVVSEDNIYKGKCIGTVRAGDGSETALNYRTEKCLPANTRFEWVQSKAFEGECYEVDAQNGPRQFSRQASDQKCYPPEYDIVFEQVPGQTLGVCTMVDRKSKGELFKREVNARLCKKEMGLVSPD